MYCPNCGNKTDATKFCKYCGASLAATTKNETAAQSPHQKRRWPVVSLVALLIVALGCGAGVYYITHNDNKTSSTWQEHYDLGEKYLTDGEYEKAVIAFEAALEIEPKSVEAYLGLADAYIGVGDLESAISILEDGRRNVEDQRLEEKHDSIEQSIEAALSPQQTVAPTLKDKDVAHESDEILVQDGNTNEIIRRITCVEQNYVSGSFAGETRTETYEYDENGNLVSQHREIMGNSPDEEVVYYYNENGRIQQIDRGEYVETLYTYDSDGRLIHEEGPDYVTDYTYNDNRIQSTETGASEIISIAEYIYDGNGLLTEIRSSNEQWAEEARQAGAEWIPLYENTSYYHYYDHATRLVEVENHYSNSMGEEANTEISYNIQALDSNGIPIADVCWWGEGADVERDDMGFVTKVTVYNEEDEVDYYFTLSYEDITGSETDSNHSDRDANADDHNSSLSLYIPIVERAISEMAYDGEGLLHDIDEDGTLELLMLYSKSTGEYSAPIAVFSVIDIESGKAIYKLDSMELITLAGGGSYIAGLGSYQDEQYILIRFSSYGDVSGFETYELCSVDDLSIMYKYTCYEEDFLGIDGDPTETYDRDGVECSENEYRSFVDAINGIDLLGYDAEYYYGVQSCRNAMSLEDLLEWLKSNSINAGNQDESIVGLSYPLSENVCDLIYENFTGNDLSDKSLDIRKNIGESSMDGHHYILYDEYRESFDQHMPWYSVEINVDTGEISAGVPTGTFYTYQAEDYLN